MLKCVIIASSLFLGDEARMFPAQGSFYFHKFQDSLKVYGANGTRYGSFVIPKKMQAETIEEVFKLCVK